MTLEIGPVRDHEEATAFFRLACESLVVSQSLAEAWRDREGIENARVARVDGRLAGGLTVQRMGQFFGGRSVPCGVVRAVAVGAEHRGTRVADAFLRASLLEMRAAGLPLSMLFPATQLVYRRVGFEQAGSWVDWTVPLAELPTRARDLPVIRVPLDAERLAPIYRAFAARTAGLLDRTPWLWRRTLDPVSPLELGVYLLGPESAPEGYLVVHTERDPGARHAAIRVRDRAFLTPAAVLRAQTFLAEHRSVCDAARFSGGLVDPLIVRLPNQHQRILRREDWMLRLVDVPAALRARGYAPGLAAEVHLTVHDDVLEPHEQRLILRVADGRAEVTPGGTGAVVVDVRALAGMYGGHLSADVAWALGDLSGDEAGARVLAACFAGERPWMNEIV